MMDELACVEDAAEQGPSLERFAQAAREAKTGSTAAAIMPRLSEGKRFAWPVWALFEDAVLYECAQAVGEDVT